MHLHTFLAKLHEILKPQVYLEIGVQFGSSLALARSATAIGVDPNPMVNLVPGNLKANQFIYSMDSDSFFASHSQHIPRVDLGFIDGMHLFEYALRDFINMEVVTSTQGVIVFDDVLPYAQEIAVREQPPGDWTGDVWKVYPILKEYRPDLNIALIDTAPTGTMVVTNLGDRATKWDYYDKAVNKWMGDDEVPEYILARTLAHNPVEFLEGMRNGLGQEQQVQ
jgi:hypothetical protein